MLEVFLAVGIVVLFHSKLAGAGLLAASAFCRRPAWPLPELPTGRCRWALRVRETLLPLLLAPVLAPVVLAATEAWRAALGFSSGGGWRWLGLLACFAAIYLAGGVLSFGALMEET